MLRIIHVSDYHLESESPSFHKLNLTKALLKDLEFFANEELLLLVTGDLLDKGGTGFKNKSEAYSFFESFFITPLKEKFPTITILFIPGNHDSDRTRVNEYLDVGMRNVLRSTSEVNRFLGDHMHDINYFTRIENYKQFEKRYLESFEEKSFSQIESSVIIKISGIRVGVSCFNSSWLCKDDADKGNLIVGEFQVTKSLNFIKDCDFTIAMIHHPYEFLCDFDRRCIKPIIDKHYHLVLCGHVHELSSELTVNLVGKTFTSIANSTIGDNPENRTYINGYSVIDYFPKSGYYVHYRKYLEKYEKFVPNTDIGSENGCIEYKIPAELHEIRDIDYSYLSTISHDLLAPLTEILHTGEMYLNGIGMKTGHSDNQGVKYMVRILDSIQNMKLYLKNFESLRNTESRQIYLSRTWESVDQILSRISPILRDFSFAEISFKLNLSHMPKLKIDRQKIHLVFYNLIINAINYSYRNTIIEINYRNISEAFEEAPAISEWHEISFSNYGIGILDEEKTDIFKLFRRGKNGIKMQVGGLGLGLFTVSEIMQAHGGKSLVRQLNNPTVISILFPVEN